MARLISPEAVATAILAVVRKSGHRSITARALAAELHVSLGALYNYTPSMRSALLDADRMVYDRILLTIEGQKRAPQLREMLAENEREIRLILDPSREHAEVSESLITAFERLISFTIGDRPTAEILRSYAGIRRTEWITREEILAGLETVNLARSQIASTDLARGPDLDLDQLRVACASAIAAGPARTVANGGPQIPSELRTASCELLLQNRPGSWSFRQLQQMTGVPLARLNRTASRREHLTTATADLIVGARDGLAKADPARSDGDIRAQLPHVMCRYPHAYIEIQSNTIDLRSFTAALLNRPATDDDQLTGALVYAICHAGWRSSERDVNSWNEAPHIAASVLRHVDTSGP